LAELVEHNYTDARVLVVEDDHIMRELIVGILNSIGIDAISPVLFDHDGDGTDQFAVIRTSDNKWFIDAFNNRKRITAKPQDRNPE